MKKEERMVDDYFHIDNGGHSIEIDKFGNVEISTGFYGYSNCSLFLMGEDISGKKKFIDFLINNLTKAKVLLEKQSKE
jgi:hypothetical protein